MPLRSMLPVILLAFLVSIMVAVLAAGRGSGWTLALAVALFAVQMLFVALRLNAPFWGGRLPATETPPAAACAQSNAVLAALIWTWGAVAMLAVYSLTALKWQHWWQYGLAMLTVAGAIFVYSLAMTGGRASHRGARTLRVLVGLTTAQGVAVVVAILWIVFSGKIYTLRGDWAANEIFIGGAAMLAMVSAITVLTLRKLTREARPT